MSSSLRPWTHVESPVSDTLHAVTFGADGAYAVGSDGTVLWRGDQPDDRWYELFTNGPRGEGEDVYAVSTTDDGLAVWLAGSSGALGEYRIDRDELVDRSAPGGFEETIHCVGVTGPAGDERVYLGTGSGAVLVGARDANGISWARHETGGTAVTALDVTSGVGYAVDTQGGVFRTVDGRTWERFGLDRTDLSLTTVRRTGDLVWAAGVNGHLFRYDRTCENWTPLQVGEKDVYAFDDRDGYRFGVGESGREFYHTTRGWRNERTTTEEALNGLAVGPSDVAVGDSGVIVER